MAFGIIILVNNFCQLLICTDKYTLIICTYKNRTSSSLCHFTDFIHC